MTGNRRRLFLDISAVENLICERGSTRKILAESAGITERTLFRWLSGEVKSVPIPAVEKLASALQVDVSQLAKDHSTDVFATPDTQTMAAQLIEQENLFQIFSQRDDWPLFESILKSTMHANLPKARLGDLFFLLADARFLQGRLDSALEFATKGSEIAEQLADECLKAKASCYLGIIHGYLGDFPQAEEFYAKYKKRRRYLPDPLKSQLEISFATIYVNQESYGMAISILKPALKVLEAHDSPKSCYGLVQLGNAQLEIGYVNKAVSSFQEAIRLAIKYQRNRDLALAHLELVRAYVKSRNFEKAQAHFELGKSLYQKSINDSDPYYLIMIEATLQSGQGRLQQACENLEACLLGDAVPKLYRIAMCRMLVSIYDGSGDTENANKWRLQA